MVLPDAQISAIFEEIPQLVILHATRQQLQHEGIDNVDYLFDSDKCTPKQVADNLRRPGGQSTNRNTIFIEGETIPNPPFAFGSKSQMNLLAACNLI